MVRSHAVGISRMELIDLVVDTVALLSTATIWLQIRLRHEISSPVFSRLGCSLHYGELLWHSVCTLYRFLWYE